VIIRLAGPDDVPAVQEVERGAVVLFEDWLDETGLTPEVLHDTSEADELLAAVRRGHLWVAVEVDRVIGFAQMAILDGLAHVDELDVVPDLGRQGVGSRLLQTVIDWAAEHGYPAVTDEREIITRMNRDQLRAAQQPLKEQYKATPEAALITLRATGTLGDGVTCSVETGRALVQAGLHPATGGSGLTACSGDMLLQALVACAGVTLNAVATSIGIELRSAALHAEGDLDFRGTLGVAREVPVGFQRIRLVIDLDTDASADQQKKLLELTERYCVVYQTLTRSPAVTVSIRNPAA
jgi:uncharacterized OsmC-like protein/GNAT superfamily N-acetyltransferase